MKILNHKNREDWLETRTKGIGGSDAPPILGYPLFGKTVHDVYLDKLGLADHKPNTQNINWGNKLEPIIADTWKAEKLAKFKILEHAVVRHPKYAFIAASPDRLIDPLSKKQGLEIKNVGQFMSGEWGDSGTDQVPKHVAIQCHHYLMVTGFEAWHIGALIGGNDFREYTLEPDKEITEYILEAEINFWESHVKPQVPPDLDGSAQCRNMLNKIYSRNSKEILEVENRKLREMLESYVSLKGKAKLSKKRIEELENRIIDTIGEEEGIKWEHRGLWNKITYKEQDGNTSWKKVAEHLLDELDYTPTGKEKLVDKFKGKSFRKMHCAFEKEEV